ncbi:MAG: hypothetical protein JOZ19_16210 [Rubrobacter sp.]|nr:hypothetical protein [Rubrobacter sp.]
MGRRVRRLEDEEVDVGGGDASSDDGSCAPAIAQVAQGLSESRITSGKASPSVAISNKGDNVSLCPSVQQVTQTGNVANGQGVAQYQTKTADEDFSGSEITVIPVTVFECTQIIEQAVAAK